MRLMKRIDKDSTSQTVIEWIMTSNFWEYYVLEEWNEEDNCAFCLVDGDFQEMGLVSLDEIKPYIRAKTRDLNNLQPAPGWEWV